VIRVVVDDIAFVAADAVIRPATTTLEPTSAALRHLEQVGGPTFLSQLRVQQPLAVGAAVVTGGGELAAEFVIHAVIRSVTEPVSPSAVRRALTSAMQRAVDWQLARVAVPPLGTGAGNLSLEDAARVMIDVLDQHTSVSEYPSDVAIVVESEADKQAFDYLLKRLPQ
jgi:O-acetyl-ADP-ribose deacetylase (regulator of RNase III)